eukprot:s9_g66.t1
MPSPLDAVGGATDGSESAGEGSRNVDLEGDATQPESGSTTNEGDRWTEEEWETWWARRSWWYSWPTSTTTPTGTDGSMAQRTSMDPWTQRGDPWSVGGGRMDDERGGGADKIAVPEFSGEDDKDGMVARGYLRKVGAWKRMTRLKCSKQALALYNNLSGRAWRDAEELDLSRLDAEDGVDVFIQWISEKYLDKEVVKVGKCMLEFFKHLKKSNHQDIREFNQEYDRQVSRLKEIGCNLPDICLAWLYVDKLRLENNAELNLLSSTGNLYALTKLQEAAIIQDRMNRRLWESKNHLQPRDRRAAQHVHVTENVEDEEVDDDETSADEDDIFPEDDEETQEAFVSYQNAKSKYQAMIKARGTTTGLSKEDRIKQAKARSYCSVCKRRGHWHRDPECPMNKGANKPTSTQVSHICEAYVAANVDSAEIVAVADCACSRSLAGTFWIGRLKEHALAHGHGFVKVYQDEKFKFGDDQVYSSSTAWVFWLCLEGKWFLVKVAEVDTDVPLLLSRPVLAYLGMQYDMKMNVADFSALSISKLPLDFTPTGLPVLPVTRCKGSVPNWPNDVQWENTEIFVPAAQETYMARLGVRVDPLHPKLFLPKRLDCSVLKQLTGSSISFEWFETWWSSNMLLKDFWIEGEHYMDRIHVTPRRKFFDPREWKTNDGALKGKLLSLLGPLRQSCCYPCSIEGHGLEVIHDWQVDAVLPSKMLWIGRSRFQRAQAPCASPVIAAALGNVSACAGVEDAPSLYMEVRGPIGKQGLGLSKCTVAQLKERCVEEHLAFPHNATQGVLLRLLRFSLETNEDSEVTFGQYKNYLFKEVPKDYLEWAVREWKTAEECCPDLARLASWAERRQRNQAAASGYGSKSWVEPETLAKHRPPAPALPVRPMSTKQSKQMPALPIRKTRGRERGMESDDFSMVTSADEGIVTTKDEIHDLEERLKILKEIKKVEDAAAMGKSGASGLENQ